MTLITAEKRPSWDPARLSLLESMTVAIAQRTATAVSDTDGSHVAVPRLVDGTVINGRYRVAGVLGEGGMGIVYGVDDLHDGERRIALKTIHRALLRPERLDLFRAEFKTMAQLAHPNVARVYDFELQRGTNDWFFTMELLEGENLLRATVDADAATTVDRIVQVCRALAYMHTRGVVHYDLKPSNICVVGDTVKVLDFGLVGASPSARAIGTPAYMAPEMFGTEPRTPDGRTDLYSLGITIYHLFSRKVPFSATSLLELAQKHASEPLSFDGVGQRVPAWLRPVVARLCAKEPAARYPNANAVIEDINRKSHHAHAVETEDTKKSYVHSSQFVGRVAELDRVLAFVKDRVQSEAPSAEAILLVGGPSGMGKSRLMREVRQQLQLAGVPFLQGDCYETGLGGLGPFDECIRQSLRLAQALGHLDLIDEFGQSLGRLVPELPFVAPARQAPPTSLSPELERRALLDRAAEFLVRLSERVPLVVYVNDLQWAGPNAIDLALLLVRNVRLSQHWERPARLAFVGSYRSDEVDGRPLEKLLAERGVERCVLKALDDESVRALTESMLGSEVPAEVATRLAAATSGVPFFVEEAMRMLVDCGLVYQHAGEWRTDDSWREFELPTFIGEAFERRVAKLAPTERALLEVVAVHDHPISIATLARVLDAAPTGIGATLLSLEEHQCVARSGTGETFEIAHARMRDALLASLTPSALSDLHRRLAEALESEHGEHAAYRLAHHFYHSGARQAARKYSLIGAERAKAENAPDTAAKLYRWALELLADEERSGAEGRGIRLSLAWLGIDLGDLPMVDEHATALLEVSTDPIERGEALLALGMRWNLRMRWKLALDHYWDALAALGERRPRTRLGVFFVVLGGIFLYFLGRARPSDADPRCLELKLRTYAEMVDSYMMLGSPALLLAFRARALARQAQGSAAKIAAEGPLAVCFIVLGRFGTAKRLAGESLETATRIGAPYERATSLATIGIAHYGEGNYALALERLNEARVQMMEYGFSHRISQVYSIYLRVLLDQGEFRRFTALMGEVQQIAQRTESSCVHMYVGGGVLARASCGEYQKAQRDRADAECQMKGIDPELATYYRQSLVFWLGAADLSAGRTDEAIAELREAIELQRQLKVPLPIQEHFDYYMSLALLAKLRRDGVLPRSEKKELARAVAGCRKAAKFGVPYRLQALVVSAAYDAWRGERVRAERQLEQLAALGEPCGASALVASAELEVGGALLRTAQDEGEGRRLVERALLAFERMGGHGLSDRARELLVAHDSAPATLQA